MQTTYLKLVIEIDGISFDGRWRQTPSLFHLGEDRIDRAADQDRRCGQEHPKHQDYYGTQ